MTRAAVPETRRRGPRASTVIWITPFSHTFPAELAVTPVAVSVEPRMSGAARRCAACSPGCARGWFHAGDVPSVTDTKGVASMQHRCVDWKGSGMAGAPRRMADITVDSVGDVVDAVAELKRLWVEAERAGLGPAEVRRIAQAIRAAEREAREAQADAEATNANELAAISLLSGRVSKRVLLRQADVSAMQEDLGYALVAAGGA